MQDCVASGGDGTELCAVVRRGRGRWMVMVMGWSIQGSLPDYGTFGSRGGFRYHTGSFFLVNSPNGEKYLLGHLSSLLSFPPFAYLPSLRSFCFMSQRYEMSFFLCSISPKTERGGDTEGE